MKILFLGRKKYSSDLLDWLIGRGHKIVGVVTDNHFKNSPTTKKAKELDLQLLSLEEAEQLVNDHKLHFDLAVSYLYWKKIREPIISKPKYGCINFHPAPLPDWRGTAGYNLAIINKLDNWAATAHYVDKNIDTGNIIKLFTFSFDYRLETAFSLEKKTQLIQMDLFKSIIFDIENHGKLNSVKQDLSKGKYISRNEMENLKKIDVSKDDIDLKIRAFWFPPYDGAYILLNNTKYTLVNKEVLLSFIDDSQTHI